MKIFYKAKFQK